MNSFFFSDLFGFGSSKNRRCSVSCIDHNITWESGEKKSATKWQKWQTTKLRQNKNLFIEFRRKTKHYSFLSPLLFHSLALHSMYACECVCVYVCVCCCWFFKLFFFICLFIGRLHPTNFVKWLLLYARSPRILWYCTESNWSVTLAPISHLICLIAFDRFPPLFWITKQISIKNLNSLKIFRCSEILFYTRSLFDCRLYVLHLFVGIIKSN